MSEAPKRIQRKGQRERLPPNTRLVARGSRWGNEFKVEEYGRDAAVDAFERMLSRKSPAELREYLAPLRGRDLACYCKPGDRCHADVLLRLANTHGQ